MLFLVPPYLNCPDFKSSVQPLLLWCRCYIFFCYCLPICASFNTFDCLSHFSLRFCRSDRLRCFFWFLRLLLLLCECFTFGSLFSFSLASPVFVASSDTSMSLSIKVCFTNLHQGGSLFFISHPPFLGSAYSLLL